MVRKLSSRGDLAGLWPITALRSSDNANDPCKAATIQAAARIRTPATLLRASENGESEITLSREFARLTQNRNAGCEVQVTSAEGREFSIFNSS